MKISVFETFPDYAKEIRTAVFVREQGFQDEFDQTDAAAVHIVTFDDDIPIATCRIFWDTGKDSYVLGRLAVLKKYRGRDIGSAMIKEAEKYVKKMGGKGILLHAQCRASDFYKKSGFTEFGNIENEEGCPHIWMKKSF